MSTNHIKSPSRTYKQVLGFAPDSPNTPVITPDALTIFQGNTYTYLEWFRQSAARYSSLWGWYFLCTDPIPADAPWRLPDAPETLTEYLLPWSAVSIDDNTIKTESEIKSAVEAILYPTIEGEWVGVVGERLEVYLTVLSVTQYVSNYGGTSSYHVFTDDLGNRYVWNTSAKTLVEGKTYKMRGTVKELITKKGYKINVLTRCLIRD